MHAAAKKKILIVKPSSFGDIVQALPVAVGLRQAWPDAEIGWLAFDLYEPLLRDHHAIDRLILLPKRFLRPTHWLRLWRWVRRLREERFDMVLDLQGLFRSGLLTWLTGAPVRVGLATAREGSTFFYTETILEPPPRRRRSTWSSFAISAFRRSRTPSASCRRPWPWPRWRRGATSSSIPTPAGGRSSGRGATTRNCSR